MKPTEKVTVKDPFTGKEKEITLDRAGHTEHGLIIALANPDLNRDQKDHALSMYLFERGKDSMSMIVDLMRYKGEHTKESRVFQSRMRYDFEAFVNTFIIHLQNQATRIGKIFKVDIREEKQKLTEWLKLPNNNGKGYTYLDYCQTHNAEQIDRINSLESTALIEAAIYDLDEANRLRKAVDTITNARMASMGYGIYISKAGQPFNTNDPDLDEVLRQDREIIKQAEEEQNVK